MRLPNFLRLTQKKKKDKDKGEGEKKNEIFGVLQIAVIIPSLSLLVWFMV